MKVIKKKISDKDLVEACLKQDRIAQKELYDRYSGLLMGICLRYANDVSEAEDILQEVMIKVFLNIADYTFKGSFIGWLRKIVVNTAITHYHKNLKHKYYVEIDELYDTKSGEDILDTPYTAEELQNTLDQLPLGYKTVFSLYAIEGYKHKEIAQMLNIDVNTSKSQYSRAKKFIQKKLQQYN